MSMWLFQIHVWICPSFFCICLMSHNVVLKCLAAAMQNIPYRPTWIKEAFRRIPHYQMIHLRQYCSKIQLFTGVFLCKLRVLRRKYKLSELERQLPSGFSVFGSINYYISCATRSSPYLFSRLPLPPETSPHFHPKHPINICLPIRKINHPYGRIINKDTRMWLQKCKKGSLWLRTPPLS